MSLYNLSGDSKWGGDLGAVGTYNPITGNLHVGRHACEFFMTEDGYLKVMPIKDSENPVFYIRRPSASKTYFQVMARFDFVFALYYEGDFSRMPIHKPTTQGTWRGHGETRFYTQDAFSGIQFVFPDLNRTLKVSSLFDKKLYQFNKTL